MITHGRRATRIRSSAAARTLSLVGVVVLGVALALPGSPAAASVVAKVELGTLGQFGVLAASTVTNSGATVLTGVNALSGLDLGVSPGTAVTGFPPGIVAPPGVKHITDGVAAQAQLDATTAYNQAAGLPADSDGLTNLGGQKLAPGVYQGNLSITGTLTLDNSNNPDAVFVFQASSTLTTASSSVVTFTNTEHPSCNVFWQVGSSATLGSGSRFAGTLVAHTSISVGTAATIKGRLAARGVGAGGAVTLLNNTITRTPCGAPVVSTPPTTPSSSVSSTPPTVPSVPTTSTPPSTSKAPTSVPTTPITTPPPNATTTGTSLSITRPSTTTTAAATTTRRTTASNQTSTRRSTTSRQTSTSTDIYGSSTRSTYSSTYTADTTSGSTTEALGIDTGSGSGGELAATGPKVTGVLIAGMFLLLGGAVVLMFGSRRRITTGRHRHL